MRRVVMIWLNWPSVYVPKPSRISGIESREYCRMMRSKRLCCESIALMPVALFSTAGQARDRTAWMAEAQWGVMTHYLADWKAREMTEQIRLMVYLPSGAPAGDATARGALQWQNGPHRNREFQLKWEQSFSQT